MGLWIVVGRTLWENTFPKEQGQKAESRSEVAHA